MHLAYDAKRLFANASGLGNYSRTLLEGLVKHHPQHTYSLFTPRIHAAYAQLDLAQAEQVNVRHYAGPAAGLWRTFRIAQELAARGVDLYHGLSHELPRGIEHTGVRSVVTMHDLIYLLRPELFPWVDRQLYHWKVKHALRTADHVIAITEQTRRDLLDQFPALEADRVSVVYQSCDARFFAQPECSVDVKEKYHLPERYLLSVGSIVKRKNLEVVLRALAQLPAGDRLPLVAVGRGRGYTQALRKLAAELGIAELFLVVDSLDDTTELIEVIRSAALFLYPSVYEGFGIPVIEALLCGTPVIASSAAAIREAGGPGARYVDPHDVTGFAEAIQKDLQHPAQARERMAAGRRYVQANFHSASVSERLIKLYAQVLAQ